MLILYKTRAWLDNNIPFRSPKYSQHNLIIWPGWIKSWVFVYELSLRIGIPFLSLKDATSCQNQFLDCLTDLSFWAVNRLFILSYESIAHRTGYKQDFLPTVEINDYNVIIDERNVFDQAEKNYLRTYDNIQWIIIVQGDDYKTDYLLDNP